MRNCVLKFMMVVAMVLSSTMLSAQNMEQLKESIRRAEEEIRITTAMLNKTQKERDTNLNHLKLIQSRIHSRRSILNSLNRQISLINRDINTKSSKIKTLEAEYKKIQKEYGELIYSAYKNYKMNNYLLFLFASSDFNDATRRISYINSYNTMKEQKAQEVTRLSEELKQEIESLDKRKSELAVASKTKSKEIATMAKDESLYNKTVKNLQAQSGKLSGTIRDKQAQIHKAQQQIAQIIAEENRKNKGTKLTAEEEKYIVALTGRFDQNIGRLPYPIKGGVIVDRFGVHAHATIKNLKVNNKGVNIAGNSGSPVYSIFEGVVSRVLFIPGLNKSVMIRHGDYITVYSNLSDVTVKNGDKVGTAQKIGTLLQSNNPDDCILHFEIWKGMENKNPESFIKR